MAKLNRNLKFKQIAVGQFRTRDGANFVPLGLGIDGKVYKFLTEYGWITLEKAAEYAMEKREEDD